jgi:hypothetical protein
MPVTLDTTGLRSLLLEPLIVNQVLERLTLY